MKKVLSIVGGVVAVLGVLAAVDAFLYCHRKKYLPDEVEAEICFSEELDKNNGSSDPETNNQEDDKS